MLFPDPSTDRLLANLDAEQPSLCAYVFSHPNMVEVAGLAGIDLFHGRHDVHPLTIGITLPT